MISRCSVCETTTRVIAFHSQSMDVPNCPGGWEELWLGYSYYMVIFYIKKVMTIIYVYNFIDNNGEWWIRSRLSFTWFMFE